MKIIDWFKENNLILETMEIEERDDVIVIPAWQFVLLINKLKEYRHSMIIYFGLLIVMFVFWVWSVYLP
jgi:hypothetical protein